MACSAEDSIKHCSVVKFMFKCIIKLNLTDTALASACVLYHKFFKECSISDYDPHNIAATALYLSSKINEEPTRLQDIVNVCYNTLHSGKSPLELNSEYWSLRDSIANHELLMLRVLKFNVSIELPHKYLLHHLLSLSQLFGENAWKKHDIANLSWAMLKDSYLSNNCIDFAPQLHSIAIVDLALQCCKAKVPLNKHAEVKWWKALYQKISSEDVVNVQCKIIDTYNLAI